MLMQNLSPELKRRMIEEIQDYFLRERDEEIGEIGAEICFEFIKERLGPVFYNEALREARESAEQKMQMLEDDLYALEKRPFE